MDTVGGKRGRKGQKMREGKRTQTRRKGDAKENIRGGREDAEEEKIKQKRVGG